MGGKAQSKKRKDWPLIVAVAIVAVAAALIYVFGPSFVGQRAEFTIIIHYRIDMDPEVATGENGPGTVNLTGNVTNIGSKGGTPVVHITVSTGYTTETFTVQMAPIVAGDHSMLSWAHHFDMLDRDLVTIQCEVEALKS